MIRAGVRPHTTGMTAGVGVKCGHRIGILEGETQRCVIYGCRRRNQKLCQDF